MTADYHSSYGWVIPLLFVGPLVTKWLLTTNLLCISWELRDLTLHYTPQRYLSVHYVSLRYLLEILSNSASPATKEQTCLHVLSLPLPACSPANITCLPWYLDTIPWAQNQSPTVALWGWKKHLSSKKHYFIWKKSNHLDYLLFFIFYVLCKPGTFLSLSAAWSFSETSTLGSGWKLFLPKRQLCFDWRACLMCFIV